MRIKQRHFNSVIIDYITNGEVVGLELVAPDAITKWKDVLGAPDPADAAPGTLRREYGISKLQNIAHGVSSKRDAKEVCLNSSFHR